MNSRQPCGICPRIPGLYKVNSLLRSNKAKQVSCICRNLQDEKNALPGKSVTMWLSVMRLKITMISQGDFYTPFRVTKSMHLSTAMGTSSSVRCCRASDRPCAAAACRRAVCQLLKSMRPQPCTYSVLQGVRKEQNKIFIMELLVGLLEAFYN